MTVSIVLYQDVVRAITVEMAISDYHAMGAGLEVNSVVIGVEVASLYGEI